LPLEEFSEIDATPVEILMIAARLQDIGAVGVALTACLSRGRND